MSSGIAALPEGGVCLSFLSAVQYIQARSFECYSSLFANMVFIFLQGPKTLNAKNKFNRTIIIASITTNASATIFKIDSITQESI